jgi:predicted nucleic acid-binding protein
MARTVLIDSGAIVAALCRRDQHQAWAKAHLQAFTVPCLSCEAVISESLFLLRRESNSADILCALLERGVIASGFALDGNLKETLRLIRRFKDIPMSFADACLVRMSEIHDDPIVFTTDRDFEAYRKNGRQTIPLIVPWQD